MGRQILKNADGKGTLVTPRDTSRSHMHCDSMHPLSVKVCQVGPVKKYPASADCVHPYFTIK